MLLLLGGNDAVWVLLCSSFVAAGAVRVEDRPGVASASPRTLTLVWGWGGGVAVGPSGKAVPEEG